MLFKVLLQSIICSEPKPKMGCTILNVARRVVLHFQSGPQDHLSWPPHCYGKARSEKCPRYLVFFKLVRSFAGESLARLWSAQLRATKSGLGHAAATDDRRRSDRNARRATAATAFVPHPPTLGDGNDSSLDEVSGSADHGYVVPPPPSLSFASPSQPPTRATRPTPPSTPTQCARMPVTVDMLKSVALRPVNLGPRTVATGPTENNAGPPSPPPSPEALPDRAQYCRIPITVSLLKTVELQPVGGEPKKIKMTRPIMTENIGAAKDVASQN